ncbi:MAG: alpha-(1-_3)-arabinofuranosyltransferase family protein [Solirubrobacteraceae bacterium]
MSRTRRELWIPLVLGAGSFALAFAQRPGWATADTKINLHVSPGAYLSQAAAMWTSTGQLGDVQAGQQTGYLFPMGPFFALGHALGISDWVVQRLWLGSLLALATWGMVRLLDALLGGRRGSAQLVAGAVLVLNPFVVTYVNRTTVTLLAYAALPWLMLVVHRGLRDPRRWRWAAAAALLVTASGGGVNGAVTAWMLLGPVLLALYEVLFADADWSGLGALGWRTVTLTVLASLWWVVPAYVQSIYGIDFLHFTEQPGTIWGTTSITESLRLMSFWLSYVGIGFQGTAIAYFDDSRTLLFSAPVVVATLLLPAAALTGFVWTRRWRYGPFFLALAIIAVVIMAAGFPPSTPLRHGLTFTYNHVSVVQFLRASYKAAPLLAVALACLAGAAAPHALAALRSAGGGALAVAGAALFGAVLCLAAWPLVTGRAQDKQVSYKQVPAAWSQAAADLDHDLPANFRAMVLPGDLFSFYDWGGTVDPILPALTSKPVAERAEVPYADLRATDLMWTIDSLVHQQRLLPGQLAPLLGLIGVRTVVTGADDDLARSDAPAPADAAAVLDAQPGFARPTNEYGPIRSFAPTSLGPRVKLAQVRTYDLPPGRGIVSVQPRANPVIVDGSASALAELAAFGALPATRAILYSADLGARQMRTELAAGGDVVISDSNRRQALVAGSLEQNTGPVLTSSETVSSDGELLDPFGRGPDYETVATYGGIRSVQAPYDPERAQFPEHGPFAAIDGSTATAWLADPTLAPGQWWLSVDFARPIDIGSIRLMPYDDPGGSVEQVTIAGRTFDVHRGWNRLPVNLHGASGLTVALTKVSPPEHGVAAGAGGIRELQIPGVHAMQALRLPVDAATDLRGANLDGVSLAYLFQRITGDDPYQRDLAHGPWSALNVRQPGDAEQQMRRVFELPAARSFTASGWVEPFSQTSDAALDRLAGYRGPVVATSSSRFDGEPQWRASRAFDGNPATAWIGDWVPGAWLRWSDGGPMTVSRLRLLAPTIAVRRPTRVELVWPGGSSGPLAVSPDGDVTLRSVVHARQFRLEVLSAASPAGATPAQRRAVGIAEIEGVSGLPRVSEPRRTSFAARCGSASFSIGGQTVALRVSGTSTAFETGTPLPATSCGVPLALTAGTQYLAVTPGPFAVDDLRLSSPAPNPPAVAAQSGTVINAGSYDHVRVSVSGPSWLVLGQSYDRGWQATCNGRSLGSPTPVNGYANGWRIGRGCRNVTFTFGPQKLADIAYIVSGIAGLACLVLLLLPPWTSAAEPAPEEIETDASISASTPARAILAGVVAGAVIAFVFGIQAGIVAIPAVGLILWRGVGARTLVLVAGLLLGVVVPVLYLVHTGDQRGANHFGYAMDHLAANWVGVAALIALMAALVRTLAPVLRSRTAKADRRRARSQAA